MQNINQTTKYIISGIVGLMLVSVLVLTAPAKADASFNFLDPLGLLDNDSDFPLPLPPLPGLNTSSSGGNRVVNNTYTNSNNVNSNINSPGATVVAENYGTPAYNYGGHYNYPPEEPNYGSLQVNCYPTPLSADEGEVVRWYANAYGGNGSYNYSWNGTNGLSGQGSSVSKRYNSGGYKNATVTVRSGGQTITRNCDGSVYIYEDNDNYTYPNQYNQISISCSPDRTSVNTGTTVRWTAYVYGDDDNNYSIRWNGTDGLSGSGRSVSQRYNTPGQKYAAITVRIDGETVTQYCTNTVQVIGYEYNQVPTYQTNELDVACAADPISARINQPVTWRTEVAGGYAPYTYTWSGSDGLAGNDSAVTKYYSTTGSKNAIVTVRSADGKTATRACSNTTTIRSNASAAPKPVVVQPATTTTDDALSAAALFSLQNVPWGWIAILIILVLFATIVYLIYNRPKI